MGPILAAWRGIAYAIGILLIMMWVAVWPWLIGVVLLAWLVGLPLMAGWMLSIPFWTRLSKVEKAIERASMMATLLVSWPSVPLLLWLNRVLALAIHAQQREVIPGVRPDWCWLWAEGIENHGMDREMAALWFLLLGVVGATLAVEIVTKGVKRWWKLHAMPATHVVHWPTKIAIWVTLFGLSFGYSCLFNFPFIEHGFSFGPPLVFQWVPLPITDPPINYRQWIEPAPPIIPGVVYEYHCVTTPNKVVTCWASPVPPRMERTIQGCLRVHHPFSSSNVLCPDFGSEAGPP